MTAGRVVIEGTCLSEMTDDEPTIFRRRHIGIIFPFFNLLPTLTAMVALRDGRIVDEVTARDRTIARDA